jgi:hypothetical protein
MSLLVNFRILFIFLLIILFSCKKENGTFFLRIIPPTDTTIISLQVTDADGNFPIDGNFHEVNNRIELSYELKNLIKYETIDWTPQMIYDHYTYSDFPINKYVGELENVKQDRYYTLNISYTYSKSDPIYVEPIHTQWGAVYGDYYFYSYDYFDNSSLTFSLQQ